MPSSGQQPRRRFLGLAAGAAALPAVSRIAWAQAYPTRPITIVVPFAAGGGTDTLARIIAQRIRGSLSQPIIIENVAGATGILLLFGQLRAAQPTCRHVFKTPLALCSRPRGAAVFV
jgi:tripartite-type tricarboxylate transporter receptor subunit TctC